jgi:uncharacterized protein
VAGGTSMGGEPAVTLAGIDQRVSRVAAIVSSSDWTRQGMHAFDDPSIELDVGKPDAHSQSFYEQLDPLTHLDRCAHGPWITVECGQEDFHVPAEGARHFRQALRAAYPGAGERVRVTVQCRIWHLDGLRSPELYQRCLEWLGQAVTER